MHRVRRLTRVFYRTLTYIIPLSSDERLASTVTASYVSPQRIYKERIPVIITMHIDDPPVRALMHTLKYHGSVESAEHISQLLAKEISTVCTREHIDYIVPIPLSLKRFRTRGFNQVTYACEHMAHHEPHIGALLFPTLLKRNRETQPQTKLNRSERMHNVSGAFTCETVIEGKRILLIDDVVTTGATLLSAKRALMDAGAASVTLCAFAGR